MNMTPQQFSLLIQYIDAAINQQLKDGPYSGPRAVSQANNIREQLYQALVVDPK